jgi:(p)ppGpp synthase/HD superfamily hydrolase
MNDDVRIVLIKLADRLHNMRTLGYLSPTPPARSSPRRRWTFFAPLANRLGIWRMKWELEDLSLPLPGPRSLPRHCHHALTNAAPTAILDLHHIIEHLTGKLSEHGIKAKVTGRPKHIYSIYRKMQRKDVSYDQVYDIRRGARAGG